MSKSGKGSAFEREICTKLSLWWTDGENDAVFWRTANSGGRATTRGKKGKGTKGQHGDIAAIDPIGEPFTRLLTIEIKRGYNRFTIADLLDKPAGAAKQKYEEWFEKIVKTSEAAGSWAWLLIVKRDRRETICFMPWCLYRDIAGHAYLAKFEMNCVVICMTFQMFLDGSSRKNIEEMSNK